MVSFNNNHILHPKNKNITKLAPNRNEEKPHLDFYL